MSANFSGLYFNTYILLRQALQKLFNNITCLKIVNFNAVLKIRQHIKDRELKKSSYLNETLAIEIKY